MPFPWAAAAALAGSVIGADSQHKANRANLRFQREFAQHGIQWRVADAKAAGLHPLYALGAQVPQFSPSFQAPGTDYAAVGAEVGRGIHGLTKEGRAMAALNLKLIESQLAESDARIGVLRSEAARNMQEAYHTAPIPQTGVQYPEGAVGFPLGAGELYEVGQAQESIPGTHSGNPNDFWQRYNIGQDGRGFPVEMVLPGKPGESPTESLESLSESMPLMALVFRENQVRYGARFTDWFFERYWPSLGKGKQAELESILKDMGWSFVPGGPLIRGGKAIIDQFNKE